jgi:predicted RNase H-like nuclease (RuvC/YqgF family)
VYLIVGVDPGTTKGIAALDFRGNVVGVLSGKEMGLDAVLEYLIGLGTVSVVATDVCPAPDFVLKVASRSLAQSFMFRPNPRKSLTRWRQ